MSDAGDKILKLSAPMVAVGAAVVKTGSDFESSMSDVTATAKLTSEEASKLSEKALASPANFYKMYINE